MTNVVFDDESPEHLACSLGLMFNKSSYRYNTIKEMMYGSEHTKALRFLPEAWSILISDGFIYAPDIYDRIQPVVNYHTTYRATKRLNDACKSGQLLSRIQVQEDITGMLHPSILNASISRYKEGAYQDAAMAASHRVETHLREVSELFDVGTLDSLTGLAFKTNGPLAVLINDDTASHGLMGLFKGMAQLIRNPTHHHLLDMNDKHECLRILAFLSYLHYQLDTIDGMKANAVKHGNDPFSAP